MGYLGLVKLGANLTFYANIHTPSTGAAVDADAAPGYRVYEDETGTPLLTGSMALLDDANTTGFYSEQVAVTGANGFEAGKSYCVRITGIVAGVTGVEVHQFDVSAKLLGDLNDAVAPANADITAIKTVTDNLAGMYETDGPVKRFTTNALEQVPSGSLTAAAIADAVLDEAQADHETPGSIGKSIHDAGSAGDPWAAAVRTLTQTAAQVAAVLAGANITIQRGDNLSVALTGLGNIAARTKLYFTVKDSPSEADTEALIQIEETAGLVYLNAAAGTAGNGDIAVTDAVAGNITITLTAAETAKLTPTGTNACYYDVQMVTASGVTTLTEGRLTVSADVTRATS